MLGDRTNCGWEGALAIAGAVAGILLVTLVVVREVHRVRAVQLPAPQSRILVWSEWVLWGAVAVLVVPRMVELVT